MAKSKRIVTRHRQATLEHRRTRKMARSVHAFVRGSTARFYRWLASREAPSIPDGPPIWICGDCHVGNLGPVADENGRVQIQIRDFDQCAIANPAFDLCRLALSLAVLARSSDLPGISTAHMLEHLLQGYEAAFPETSDPLPPLPPSLHVEVRRAHRRSWKALARERTEGETLHLPLGGDFWPITKRERKGIASLFQDAGVAQLATQLRERPSSGKVSVLDGAYWRKGCSSLGRLRFAVLLDVDGAASEGNDLCLMDIKEATDSLVPAARSARQPKDPAVRVLEAARQLSPALGERMIASTLLERPVFVRELMPQDLKLDIVHVSQKEARRIARYLGTVVGRAHARQLDINERSAWRRELRRNHSRSLSAPSWLWRATVGLLADHESAYLEHCRRYVGATDRA